MDISLLKKMFEMLGDEERTEQNIADLRENLSAAFLQAGYASQEIDEVLDVLFASRDGVRETRPLWNEAIIRSLSDIEQAKLSDEARSVLRRVELYGLLTPEELEIVLEQALRSDGVVSREEMEYILASTIYGSRDVEAQQTLFNVMEGNTFLYH